MTSHGSFKDFKGTWYLWANRGKPHLALHLLFGFLVFRLQATLRIKEGQEALEAVLRLCRDASNGHPQAKAESLYELVRRLLGTQAFHIAHVHSHATRNHSICGHGSQPFVHILHQMPGLKLGPFANERTSLCQDLRSKGLHLDLIEAAREKTVTRLPILRLLAAGEKSIGGEILGQRSEDIRRCQVSQTSSLCFTMSEVTGIGSGIVG